MDCFAYRKYIPKNYDPNLAPSVFYTCLIGLSLPLGNPDPSVPPCPHSDYVTDPTHIGLSRLLTVAHVMFFRRPRPLPSEPSTDPVTPPPVPDHALGFTDIYGSLTPRQISVISMLLAVNTCDYSNAQCSYRVGHRNGFNGRDGKSIIYVRLSRNDPLSTRNWFTVSCADFHQERREYTSTGLRYTLI